MRQGLQSPCLGRAEGRCCAASALGQQSQQALAVIQSWWWLKHLLSAVTRQTHVCVSGTARHDCDSQAASCAAGMLGGRSGLRSGRKLRHFSEPHLGWATQTAIAVDLPTPVVASAVAVH